MARAKRVKYEVHFHMLNGGGGKYDYAEITVKGKPGLTDDEVAKLAVAEFKKNGETWYESEVTEVIRL